MEILSSTLEVMGSALIGFMAIMVHHRFLHEHKIDKRVFDTMKREQVVGVLGIIMIVAGYILGLIYKF